MNHNIQLHNIFENIALIFQREKRHFISRDGFEYIYEK